jgi:hypothetical protein
MMERLPSAEEVGSDTEIGAERDAMTASNAVPEASFKLGRRGALSVVAATAALAASSTFAFKAKSSGAQSFQDSTVSMSENATTVSRNTGCTNWRTIMLEPDHPSIESSEAACLARCRQTPSCAGYNYQKQDECEVQEGYVSGKKTGACYLLSDAEKCNHMVNGCWDLVYMKTPAPSAWTLSTRRAGCTNWKAITTDQLQVSNPDACGKNCLQKRGCQRFNFRKDNMEEYNCLLMDGDCEHMDNPNWDLYRMNMAPPSSGSKSWAMSGPNTGCRNWKSLAIGSISLEYAADLCGARCKALGDCVAFNWQKEDGGPQYDGMHDHDGFKYGGCYAYHGECHQEYNSLWDLYTMGTSQPTAAPAPPTNAPTPSPTHANGAPAVFCPSVADLHSAGANVQLQDQGWTITGQGAASTSNTSNLLPNGNNGWIAYTIDISGVPTGKDNDKFIATSNFLSFPGTGQGAYNMDDPDQVCSSAPQYSGGGAANRFCAEMQTMETNGKEAYGVSWRLSPANDTGSAKCRSHLSVGAPPRGTCRTEKFFSPSQCTSATDPKIDSSQPFDVWALFEKMTGMTVYVKQGVDVVKIASGDLSMGTENPDAGTAGVIDFAMRSYGAAIESKLFAAGWAPGSGSFGCPDAAQSLASSVLKVSNLRVYGINHRGPQPAECADQTVPPEIAQLSAL